MREDAELRARVGVLAVLLAVLRLPWRCGMYLENKMWFKLLYDRIWIRDVFWLGPAAPMVQGSHTPKTSALSI